MGDDAREGTAVAVVSGMTRTSLGLALAFITASFACSAPIQNPDTTKETVVTGDDDDNKEDPKPDPKPDTKDVKDPPPPAPQPDAGTTEPPPTTDEPTDFDSCANLCAEDDQQCLNDCDDKFPGSEQTEVCCNSKGQAFTCTNDEGFQQCTTKAGCTRLAEADSVCKE